jgi:hypothetical protein
MASIPEKPNDVNAVTATQFDRMTDEPAIPATVGRGVSKSEGLTYLEVLKSRHNYMMALTQLAMNPHYETSADVFADDVTTIEGGSDRDIERMEAE